ncbi:MAG: radical SAM protein [Ruminococcus sp.]|nr:radical SAM protein [Candidatus Copronaster equi]
MKHINVGLFVPHNGCPHQCSFCNQRAISGHSNQVCADDVKKAVEIAIKNPDSAGGEIAFFGGSFTAIEREKMLELLEEAFKYVKNGSFKGIRISTRPDAIDNEICDILKSYGVTAVELGAQSMNDKVLILNRRGHTSNDVVNATELLKSYGFETGLQMMTGLYGSDDNESIETAQKIIALKPDTVRIYPTVVLENTELAELYACGKYKPQTVDEAVEICSRLLLMFYENDIKVIRTGLHSGGGVEGEYLAGAYHPAFKELCDGKIYLRKTLEFIEKNDVRKGRIKIYVAPSAVSQAVGQKRKNLNYLSSIGYEAKVISDETKSRYEVDVRNENK